MEAEILEGLMGSVMLGMLVIILITLAIMLFYYIAGSMLIYTLAKQKNDEFAWFAWIPYLREKPKTEVSDEKWNKTFGEHAGWKVVGIVVLFEVLLKFTDGNGEGGIEIFGGIVGLIALAFWLVQCYYFFKPYTKNPEITMLLCIIPFYYPIKVLKMRAEILRQASQMTSVPKEPEVIEPPVNE